MKDKDEIYDNLGIIQGHPLPQSAGEFRQQLTEAIMGLMEALVNDPRLTDDQRSILRMKIKDWGS